MEAHIGICICNMWYSGARCRQKSKRGVCVCVCALFISVSVWFTTAFNRRYRRRRRVGEPRRTRGGMKKKKGYYYYYLTKTNTGWLINRCEMSVRCVRLWHTPYILLQYRYNMYNILYYIHRLPTIRHTVVRAVL